MTKAKLADLLDYGLCRPAGLTRAMAQAVADPTDPAFRRWLAGSAFSATLEKLGYRRVANPLSADGRWLVEGRRRIIDLIVRYRRCAVAIGREQWRLFFEKGSFNKFHDIDKVTFAALAGSAVNVQMCRAQVVGQLAAFMVNRANDFTDKVAGSRLDAITRHKLLSIDAQKTWFRNADDLRCGGKPDDKPRDQAPDQAEDREDLSILAAAPNAAWTVRP